MHINSQFVAQLDPYIIKSGVKMEQIMERHKEYFAEADVSFARIDGQVYSRCRSEDLAEAERLARKSPVSCGQLFDAASDNNLEKVKDILCYEDKSEEKVKFRKWYVNEKAWMDWRLLHFAADGGYMDMTKLALECGAEINALSDTNYTALHLGQYFSMHCL